MVKITKDPFFAAVSNKVKWVALSLIVLCIVSCNLGSQSEIIKYAGLLKVADADTVPTNIEIYAGNKNETILDVSGNLERYFITPFHPERGGHYVVGTTTRSHGPAETVEHWECGPLRLYIRHPDYQPYYDSLTNEQLRLLNSDFRHAVRN